MSPEPGREKEIQRLLGALRDDSHKTRRRAAGRLGELKAIEALEPLLAALVEFDVRDEESFVNMKASCALSELGEPAFQRVLEMLADPEGEPQTHLFCLGPSPLDVARWRQGWVLSTLNIMADPRAIPPLLDAGERWHWLRGSVKRIIQRLGMPSPVGQTVAVVYRWKSRMGCWVEVQYRARILTSNAENWQEVTLEIESIDLCRLFADGQLLADPTPLAALPEAVVQELQPLLGTRLQGNISAITRLKLIANPLDSKR